MDTQSIAPVGGPSGSDAQGYLAPTSVAGTNGTAKTKDAAAPAPATQVPKQVDLEVRTRDPRSLQYQVDSSTKQVVATIVDDSNKTVIVQIPSEEVLRIAQAIDRMKGFLLEGKA
jgi:flagellar protein FlaG